MLLFGEIAPVDSISRVYTKGIEDTGAIPAKQELLTAEQNLSASRTVKQLAACFANP
jgi:hypothetical protein